MQWNLETSHSYELKSINPNYEGFSPVIKIYGSKMLYKHMILCNLTKKYSVLYTPPTKTIILPVK